VCLFSFANLEDDVEEIELVMQKMLKVGNCINSNIKTSGIAAGTYDGRVNINLVSEIIRKSSTVEEALLDFGDLLCRWCKLPISNCTCHLLRN
jgi:hypothetical protein